MKTVYMALTAFFGVFLASGLPGQEKKDGPAKEEVVVLKTEDFPIRVGAEIVKDKEEDAKRKEEACRKKYHGKLVKVVSIVSKRAAEKDNPKVYTLQIAYAVKRGNQFLFSKPQRMERIASSRSY